jgi:hypothetical protein
LLSQHHHSPKMDFRRVTIKWLTSSKFWLHKDSRYTYNHSPWQNQVSRFSARLQFFPFKQCMWFWSPRR